MTNSTEQPAWRRSSRCGNTTCVEVAKIGTEYLVRDGKDRSAPPLRFAAEVWADFMVGIKAGEFRLK